MPELIAPPHQVILSIIIVSFNTREITRNCIKSIYAAEWRQPFEIIVVDNNSHDESVEMIHKEFPKVRLIANKDNRLFSIANNQGVDIARGKYVLLLNSDTLVEGSNLQKMVDYFESCPDDVICVGPKILNKDGSLQSCGHPEWGSYFQHLARIFHFNRVLPLHLICEPLDENPNRTHRAGWVSGACMLIPRDRYLNVGGLNENLVFYGEEPEFGFRTKRLGYKTIYFSEASIIHLGGASTKDDRQKSFEADIKSYDGLVQQTIGSRGAIIITRITKLALRIKRAFHPNKDYISSRIAHETRVIEYFKTKVKECH